jgi:capsular polysaccharide transport system permease protein
MMAARIFVEVLSNIAAALFSLFVLVMIGEMEPPRNWPMLYVGYLYMAWWCSAVSIIVSGLSERTVWVEKIWVPIGYMYIAVGGCFYLVDWLSPSVRKIALLQPSVQAYEMIRRGMFDTTVPTYFDFQYATISLALLTVIGLAALRSARRYVVLA